MSELARLNQQLALPVTFTETALELSGELVYGEWEQVGDFLSRVDRSVQWWIGDWWAYGDHEYGDRAQAAAETRFAFGTCMNAGWVCRQIETSRRREVLSFGHHQAVATLSPPEQDDWLERAAMKGWSREDLRRELRARRTSPPPLPTEAFACLVADPPWEIATGPVHQTGGPARPLTYPSLSVEEIAALPVPVAADAHLYLWTINAYLAAAYEIARAWGFEPSTLLVWCKTPNGLGLGGTFSLSTEYVLFARRGTLEAKERVDGTAFHWKRGRHSVKPDEFYDLVERVSPGPYLELFARRERSGWTSWGDEVSVAA